MSYAIAPKASRCSFLEFCKRWGTSCMHELSKSIPANKISKAYLHEAVVPPTYFAHEKPRIGSLLFTIRSKTFCVCEPALRKRQALRKRVSRCLSNFLPISRNTSKCRYMFQLEALTPHLCLNRFWFELPCKHSLAGIWRVMLSCTPLSGFEMKLIRNLPNVNSQNDLIAIVNSRNSECSSLG